VARAAAAHAAVRLDATLLAPWATLLGDRGLVIVPVPMLHGLPWSVLPSCRGRPVTVSPTGSPARAAADHPLLLVAAPSPPRAGVEVAAIARSRPDATVLMGPRASTTLVRAALSEAETVHLAAHGAPSHLSLVDGPLGMVELARFRPRLTILSACDAGLSALSLLRLGLRTVVASVGPVDDATTGALMVDLHRRLRAGAGPAEALAAAQAEFPALSGGYGFVCFATGEIVGDHWLPHGSGSVEPRF
jgi:hypothetical protein